MDRSEYIISLIGFWKYKENKLHISDDDIKDLSYYLNNKLPDFVADYYKEKNEPTLPPKNDS